MSSVGLIRPKKLDTLFEGVVFVMFVLKEVFSCVVAQ